ncbi:MAG: response regulator [Treponema sp.]|nr:response regulator [Treponema sp.]
MENKKILIIDDEKINILSLAHFLNPQYEIIVAKNGITGIKAAEKQKPDLILLDVIMPEMNGYEVLEKLKESDETKDIPVIFITGMTNAENKEKGQQLGAVDFISKPFDKAVVKEKIDLFFKN